MAFENTLTIIGCGHSESLVNHNNNALITNPNGRMMIDCGHTAKHALHDAGLSIGDIDEIYITHVHGDHVFGLERFAYEARFKHQKKIRLIFREEIYEELWDQTLKGSLARVGEGEAKFSDYFELSPISGNTFESLGNHIELVEVSHTPSKLTTGLVINNKIFYSSDTIAIPEAVQELTFDTGFHDVTLTSSNPVHATLDSLISLYPESIRKKLYLMSYEDNWPEFETQVQAHFAGFAKQGMKVTF